MFEMHIGKSWFLVVSTNTLASIALNTRDVFGSFHVTII
jgi:hypothetical protein